MNDAEKQSERASKNALLDSLRAAGAKVQGDNRISCPFHEDAHPSAGVYEDGCAWKFKCHGAGCGFQGDVFDVRAKAAGATLGDVLPRSNPTAARKLYATLADMVGDIRGYEKHHSYTNPETGKPDLIVVRSRGADGKKKFIQAVPQGSGFVMGGCPKPWPLYNRSRLRDVPEAIVVEGEKCVEALHRYGIVATTSPGGAGKACHADWSAMSGKEKVILWPDNDPGGIAHMVEVAGEVSKLPHAPPVYKLDPSVMGLPPKGDVADFIATLEAEGKDPNGVRTALAAVWDIATLVSAPDRSGGLDPILADTVSGKRRSLDWCWPSLNPLTFALLPGTTTLLCGTAGSGKSFAAIQQAFFLHANGESVAVKMLEETKAWHLLRVTAQVSGDGRLLNDAWVRENGAEALSLRERTRGAVDSFAACLEDGDGCDTYADIAEWAQAKADAGARVLFIDPITYADGNTGQVWVDDKKFVKEMGRLLSRYDLSLVLVTHPKMGGLKAKNADPLDSIAGGAAYNRFTQTILWYRRLLPNQTTVRVRRPCGFETVEANRMLVIPKARNGPGGEGAEVAMRFDRETMRLKELGEVIREQ